jgi:hypothetical protein
MREDMARDIVIDALRTAWFKTLSWVDLSQWRRQLLG